MRVTPAAGSVVLPALVLGVALATCKPAPEPRTPAKASPGTGGGAALPAEPAGPPDPDVAATVTRVIGSAHHPQLRWPDIPDVAPTLKLLYEAEPDGLFWFAGKAPYPGLAGAVAGLAFADEHGLDHADYDARALAERWAGVRDGTQAAPAQRALLDLGLTASLARLLSAVHVGRVDPATLRWGYDITPKALDRAAILRELREGGDIQHALAYLEPPFPHYARARRALARYKAAAAAGEPAPVPELPKGQRKVEPGKPWEGGPQLAARLTAFGDLRDGAAATEATNGEPPVYTAPLVDAVKAFQARHGLAADGVIGAGTIGALNVPIARRVRQLELALERMRWLPKLSDRPTVFVNVALFRLWATDPHTGQEPLRMNVVVGKSLDHATPIFVGRMEYVIFRPYWNPPYGITVNEIVPHVRRDPAYFARENLEIVASGDEAALALPPSSENLDKVIAGTLFVRQKPGPKNSLGLAKFIFPNAENVYMHGTPSQQLFSRARRDFSHGCIRLEDPTRLAQFVLRDQPEWTRETIEAAMQANHPTRVNLKEPLTVVLFYATVHVNSEGVVSFVEDIYRHDRQLDAALEQGYPYPTKG
jgi:murein L,D-transpeptidase YcbB/YkuD